MAGHNCRIARWRPRGSHLWSEILPVRPVLAEFEFIARRAVENAHGEDPEFYALVVVHDDGRVTSGSNRPFGMPEGAVPALTAYHLTAELLRQRMKADG